MSELVDADRRCLSMPRRPVSEFELIHPQSLPSYLVSFNDDNRHAAFDF